MILGITVLIALGIYYFVGIDEGMTSVFGKTMVIHEWVHDSRHFLGFPCHLGANVANAGQFGYARAATETPQAITNILSVPLHVNGKIIEPGQIVYPGFDPDVLWKFRWYSILNQLLIWTTIALVFGTLLDRFLQPAQPAPRAEEPDREPIGASS